MHECLALLAHQQANEVDGGLPLGTSQQDSDAVGDRSARERRPIGIGEADLRIAGSLPGVAKVDLAWQDDVVEVLVEGAAQIAERRVRCRTGLRAGKVGGARSWAGLVSAPKRRCFRPGMA